MARQDSAAPARVAAIIFCMLNHTILLRTDGRLHAALHGEKAHIWQVVIHRVFGGTMASAWHVPQMKTSYT